MFSVFDAALLRIASLIQEGEILGKIICYSRVSIISRFWYSFVCSLYSNTLCKNGLVLVSAVDKSLEMQSYAKIAD